MDVCLLCLYVVLSCVGRGLCDGLISRPEESYRVSNCVCDHRNPERCPVFQVGNESECDATWAPRSTSSKLGRITFSE
jgi:hypothetical protein